MSFVESAYPDGRPPTSVLGALAAHPRRRRAISPPSSQPFGKGAKPVFVAASTNREILLAAGLRSDLGFRTVLVADQNCGRFSKALKDGVTGVILDALVLNRQPFERGHLSRSDRDDLPIAFATWAPFKSPGSLRLSAAIAARLGLPADRVLRALTLDAAKILGVDAQIGSLKAGKDADLIVLSAPITDARARLLLCVQDGKVVFRAKKEGSMMHRPSQRRPRPLGRSSRASLLAQRGTFTIRAEKLYVGDGTVIAPALVTIEGGQDRHRSTAGAVGRELRPGLRVENACVTPGFVEGIELGRAAARPGENEEKSEVTAVRARLLRARRERRGVPQDARGRRDDARRVARQPQRRRRPLGRREAARWAPRASSSCRRTSRSTPCSASSRPSGTRARGADRRTLFARRPNSRMGVVFELRRAFQEGCERNGIGTRGKSCFCDADGKLLGQVMKGEIPLAMTAHAEQDILTALNIADEFGAKNFWLEGAVEAWLQRDLLARRGIPVLIGPVYHSSQILGGRRRRPRRPAGPRTAGLTDKGGILGGPEAPQGRRREVRALAGDDRDRRDAARLRPGRGPRRAQARRRDRRDLGMAGVDRRTRQARRHDRAGHATRT